MGVGLSCAVPAASRGWHWLIYSQLPMQRCEPDYIGLVESQVILGNRDEVIDAEANCAALRWHRKFIGEGLENKRLAHVLRAGPF